MIITSSSIKETGTAAIEILKYGKEKHDGKNALVFLLSGQLGAGKTAFVQAVARSLKIKQPVTSPTFVLMKKYPIPKSKLFLIHIDAYRIKSQKEMPATGFADIMKNPANIVFIEWPENMHGIFPKNSVHVSITHGKKETERTLTVV